MPKYVPISFQPDADPSWLTNPGVLTDVRNLVPTVRGTYVNYASTSAENFTSIAALSSALVPNTAKIMKRVGVGAGTGSARFFIGTDTDLLEARVSASAISNVSKSAAAYVAAEWSFDAYGDSMLACAVSTSQPATKIQVSTGAANTAFADLSNSPKAYFVVVQKNFVVAYNCYDGTNWYTDGWMCSGLGNSTSWAANFTAGATVSTQANYGRLLESSGAVTAAYRLRDGIAVYKADSIYLAQYTGPITTSNPATWAHRLVTDKIGVGNHNAVAIVGGVHYFIHRTGVYRFDGSYPQAIGDGQVDTWLAQKIGRLSLYQNPGFRAVVNEQQNIIIWYLATTAKAIASTICSDALVYNYVTGKFGWISNPWFEQDGTDYYFCCPVQGSANELRSWSASMGPPQWDMLTVGSIASNIYIRGSLFGRSSRSSNTTATLYTGDIGDDIGYTTLTRVKPRMLVGDDDSQSSTCTVDFKDSEGDFYNHSGLQLLATSTSAASGNLRVTFNPGGIVARTIASGDYLSMQVNMLQGALTTPVGIRITFADATTLDVTTTFTALDTWTNVAFDMTASVGKVFSTMAYIFGTPGATGVHQTLIRNIRFTDVSGVMRQRLFYNGDRLQSVALASLSNYTLAYEYISEVDSIGTTYTYATAKRRYDGTKSGRLLRPKITLYNKSEIGGLWVDSVSSGTE